MPPGAQILAAAKTHPLERFVAAAAWWPEGTVGRFQLACQPGVACDGVAGRLLDGLTQSARQAGLRSIQYASLLTEQSEWFGSLRANGFESLRSERAFEVACSDAWTRIMRLYSKWRSQMPASWRTEPIRAHPPEIALELIAPHRLMLPAEVRNHWRAEAQAGFDLDLSCLLFDGQRPFGAFLVRRMGEGLYFDVQVVNEPNPRLRSLADLLMLVHDAQRVAPDGPIRWLWFRSGHTEHRQTANLALRMGGREVARGHVMARAL
jgi:hypothetical protein